jgi:thioredoxin 1
MSANTTELTLENFDLTLSSSKTPVLVDFWAPWCGPCKAIAPVLEDLGSELAGKLTIGKLNVDDAGEIAGRYGIRAIPTMILFKGGQAVETIVGLVDKAGLKAKLAGKI